jgi:hypothetical protein
VAIDRTLFNLWVDDDGTNTIGTPINKTRIASDLLDPIDAALTAGGTPGVTTDGTRVQRIAFTATQSASSDVNTLDDYEEGTWTPVIGGSGGTSGQTYTTQAGHYIKIGRQVHAHCYVALSAKGTITGDVQIQGLPFSNGGTYASVQIDWQNLAVAKILVPGYVAAANTVISLFGTTAAATSSAFSNTLTTTDIANNTGFFINFTYHAAA